MKVWLPVKPIRFLFIVAILILVPCIGNSAESKENLGKVHFLLSGSKFPPSQRHVCKTFFEELLEESGFEIVKDQRSPHDLSIIVALNGKPLTDIYVSTYNGVGVGKGSKSYSGAEISGTLYFKFQNGQNFEMDIEGRQNPPSTISSGRYSSEWDVPYDLAFEQSNVYEVLGKVIKEVYGVNLPRHGGGTQKRSHLPLRKCGKMWCP